MSSTSSSPGRFLLTLNAGSSSLKFALFRDGQPLERIMSGGIDGIGRAGSALIVKMTTTGTTTREKITAAGPAASLATVLRAIQPIVAVENLAVVGHRVVHGGPNYSAPEKVTRELLLELRRLSPIDPEHLPVEIELIEALQTCCPKLLQMACFDTAFHHDLPRVSRVLPIPRRYEEAGVRRYGFHGLSYQFLLEELQRLGDPAATSGRVILAHLGNGASLAAIRDGHSIDTTMGFTPAAGLVMSTRTGDLDPGLAAHLARTEKMTASQFQRLISHESGLLGVSGLSSDMRILLAQEDHDSHAAEAVALFCYQAKKWLGAFAAALGGLDTLVFAGGIGENCPSIRRRICEGLDFVGISVDETLNASNAAIISSAGRRVVIRVMHTDEELMIARSISARLESTSSS